MRFIKRFFITALILIALISAMGIILAYVYEDEVKKAVVSEINKQLNTVVIIAPADIQFSVLKNFPLASVEFKNITALDAIQQSKKDTLIKARTIALKFNIVDIFNKNYNIRGIEVEEVKLKITIDKNGNDNYHFWKISTDTTANNFSFKLKEVKFKDISILYKDHQQKEEYSLNIDKAKLKGDFTSKKYTLQTDGNLSVNYIEVDNSKYLKGKKLDYTLSLMVEGDSYQIQDGSIKLEKLKLDVAGNVRESGKAYFLNLAIKAKDMDIQSVFSLLPDSQKEKMKDYESEGQFYFESNIKGKYSENTEAQVKINFGINNGLISHNSTALKNINLKGSYIYAKINNGEVNNLNIENFHAGIADGNISGNFSVKDFSSPLISGTLTGEWDMAELKKFISIDTFEKVYGTIKMKTAFDGKINDWEKFTVEDFRKSKTSGEVTLENAGIYLKNSPLAFDSLNGSFAFNNNDIAVNSLAGKFLNSDFDIKGEIKNILAWLFIENETLTVDAQLKCEHLDLNTILEDKKTSPSEADTNYAIRFSEFLDLKLEANIRQLNFRKFEANDVSGLLRLKDKKLVADPLTFNTMEGKMILSGMIDGTPNDKILITCDASLKKINIHTMFDHLENFGQSVVVADNLKGYITADIKFASVWSTNLTADPDKIYARGNITIEKGELIKFESLKSLSRFIKVSELEDVKFSTLKNEIEIKNQKTYIPQMEIKSSALNITCAGTHTFNNEIDYHIKVLLNDLLSKKAKKAKKENEEFGVVEDDGLGRTNLFISMTGTVDNPIIKYDSKGAVKKIKEDLKQEKQTLKTILREEFGWFKRDSTVTKNKKKEYKKDEEDKFIIKWDEEEKTSKEDDEDF